MSTPPDNPLDVDTPTERENIVNTTLLGDDFARRVNVPLADLVYMQRAPVLLAPRRLRRRSVGEPGPESVARSGHEARGPRRDEPCAAR